MAAAPALLARGPWRPDQVTVRWREDHFDATEEKVDAADRAIQALKDRGSPSHDGLAARFAGLTETPGGGIEIELQPVRWALRLVEGDASGAVSAMLAVRDSDGRWLAGRRAAWLATWPGRWALGAGGAVDLGENPFHTLTRELQEEWGAEAERVQGEALVRLPNEMVMLIGQAWLAPGTEVRRDAEHDEHAWWPADPDDWPAEADEPLRAMARMLVTSARA